MDRNSIIGLVLIGLLVIGYSYFTAPTSEQIAVMKHQRDSVAAVHAREKQEAAPQSPKGGLSSDTNFNTSPPLGGGGALNDSAKADSLKQQLGAFASAGEGTEQL